MARAYERDKLALLLKLIEHRDGHWLAMKVEEWKIALSEKSETQLQLDRLASGLTLLQRATFDAAIAQLVAGVEGTVSRLLGDAGVDAAAVDTVFCRCCGRRLLRCCRLRGGLKGICLGVLGWGWRWMRGGSLDNQAI